MASEAQLPAVAIDHVHLKVVDLERSVNFYVALGASLEARYRAPQTETAALLLGGVRLNISTGLRSGGGGVVDHLGITVPAIDDVFTSIAANGGRQIRGPEDWYPAEIVHESPRIPFGGRFAFVEGPDGEFIELVHPRG